MKKFTFLILALTIAVKVFSQGIEFEHSAWKDVLQKAKQLNKPIFVDVFTSWCGPCKQMSTNIFPLKEVGDQYNASFVCFKIDAEKGEGPDIAKTYQVKAFPTYLFINPDGELFYTKLGSMPADEFLKVANQALEAFKDKEPLSVLEKAYPDKKSDKAFMVNYINKRKALNLETVPALDDYLSLLTPKEFLTKQNLEFVLDHLDGLTLDSKTYTLLIENKSKAFEIVGQDKKPVFDNIVSYALYGSQQKAIKNKDEKLMQQIVEENQKLPDVTGKPTGEDLWLIYYKKTEQKDKYLKTYISYIDDNIMKLTKDEISKGDSLYYITICNNIEKNRSKIPANQIESLKLRNKHFYSNQLGYKINEGAWYVFENVNDNDLLKKAVIWAGRAVELSESKDGNIIDTYANLLYRTGNKEKAIQAETEALNIVEASKKEDFEKTIEKMKKGIPTWEK
jgi:thiol-disulfide isomerase/thioredoxin